MFVELCSITNLNISMLDFASSLNTISNTERPLCIASTTVAECLYLSYEVFYRTLTTTTGMCIKCVR